MGMRVRISRCVVELIQHAAVEAAPREACGLLFGDSDTIDTASIELNAAENPLTHFEIDPAGLFAAIRAERVGGAFVVGYWHSHPSGDTQPSGTDAAMAAPDGKLWLIVADGKIGGWRAVADGTRHGRFDAVELDPV